MILVVTLIIATATAVTVVLVVAVVSRQITATVLERVSTTTVCNVEYLTGGSGSHCCVAFSSGGMASCFSCARKHRVYIQVRIYQVYSTYTHAC